MRKYFYSASTNGFYLEGLHSSMPTDVVEITEARYQTLLTELSAGKELYVRSGKPQTRDQIIVITWEDIRTKRDYLLGESDWSQMPDNNLTQALRDTWVAYRQELRDITTTYASPEAVVWPDLPA